MEAEKTILHRNINPLIQGAVIVAALLVFNLIAYIVKSSGINTGETIAWEISLTLLLFFSLANAIFFLNAKEKGKYWSYSISAYVIVCAIAIGLASWISGIGISESGSIKWIIFIFSFSYLIFISIIGFMRTIVEIAIKQDKRLRGEQ
jgi:hypothetical protein